MKPDHWKEVDQLFHLALERAPETRAAFLEEACAGRDSLRSQVDALLAAHAEAGSFMGRPAMEVEARNIARDEDRREPMSGQIGETPTGESFSHYKIISQLGVGGMGHVYLAQDTVLGRKVALKLLPPEFTKDIDRVGRFQQEARAASALNHPNIITIYEIGQVEDRHFIATEFIDGETLRESVLGSSTNLAWVDSIGTQARLLEILRIALQTSEALSAAHEAGIVHRDIKPENIMLRRRDGLVKVLDFGLAKLTEGGEAAETEATTRALIKTSAGMVMGTAHYMSPEQARAQLIDARTDIFSFGVVLYEMVAGHVPFEGDTASDVIASILTREPLPLNQYDLDVPEPLQWIITKALTKKREERYQTAKEVWADLQRLKQKLEFAAEVERFDSIETSRKLKEKPKQDSGKNKPPRSIGMARDTAAAHATSGVGYWLDGIKRHGGWTTILSLVILSLISGVFLKRWVARQNQATVKTTVRANSMSLSKVTNVGKARDAAVSPDGKFVLYVMDQGGQQSLWMRQVEPVSDVKIIPEKDIAYSGLTFSRDGSHFYYIAWDKKNPDVLYETPGLFSGVPRKLAIDLDSNITLSPDGRQFAFLRGSQKPDEDNLIVANVDGTGARQLASRNGPNFFVTPPVQQGDSYWSNAPAWSPDGKTIACPAGSIDANGRYMTVVGVNADDGAITRMTAHRWWQVGRMSWIGESGGLVFTAQEQPSKPVQLWYLPYVGGEVEKITNDLDDYRSVSLSSDASALITVQSEVVSNVWVASGDTNLFRQISSSKYEGIDGLCWTPDKKIVYVSRASGNSDLWIMDHDGNNQKQLTANAGNNKSPSVSADGRYIVFVSDRGAGLDIWRMNIDGSNPKQLTFQDSGRQPSLSPDGRWVVYLSPPKGLTLWKVSIDGGEPVLVSYKSSGPPVVSPDGKLIAAGIREPTTIGMAIYRFEGGEPLNILDFYAEYFRWAPDGRSLVSIDASSFSNLMAHPLRGGPPKQLTSFDGGHLFKFGWSADGKQLALARGSVSSDVVLIKDFR